MSETTGSVLEIRDLHVTVGEGDETKEILRGVDLTIRSGETHAIMGPNGSGKSTLAYSIAGHPKYTITGGTVTLDVAPGLLSGGQQYDVEVRARLALRPTWVAATATVTPVRHAGVLVVGLAVRCGHV